MALKGAGCFGASAHHQFSGFLHHGQPFDHTANSLYAPPGYGYASTTYGAAAACCSPWDSSKIHAPLGSKGFPWSFGAVSPLSSVMPPPPPPSAMRQHISSYQASTGTGPGAAGTAAGGGGFMAGIPLERGAASLGPVGSTPLAAAAAYLYGSGTGVRSPTDDGDGDYSGLASLRLRARQHAVSASALVDAGGGGNSGYPGSPRELHGAAQTCLASGPLQTASSCQFTLPETSCGGVAVL